MRATEGRLLPRIGGLVLGLGVAALTPMGRAESPPATPTPSTARQAPPQIHYHFHYHAPSTLWRYPGYDDRFVPGGPLTSFPLPGPWVPPTAAHPYPPGYLVGPFAPLAFENTNPRAPQDKGTIEVFLPVANAEVYLNGHEMRGTGKTRKFTTPLLPLDEEFQYYVTATYKRKGETISDYRKVDVGAGEYTVADFTRPPLDNPIKLRSGPVDLNEAVRP